jgi:hypothetical protein
LMLLLKEYAGELQTSNLCGLKMKFKKKTIKCENKE